MQKQLFFIFFITALVVIISSQPTSAATDLCWNDDGCPPDYQVCDGMSLFTKGYYCYKEAFKFFGWCEPEVVGVKGCVYGCNPDINDCKSEPTPCSRFSFSACPLDRCKTCKGACVEQYYPCEPEVNPCSGVILSGTCTSISECQWCSTSSPPQCMLKTDACPIPTGGYKQIGDPCSSSYECVSPQKCYGTGTSKDYTCKGSCPGLNIVYAPDAQACCKASDYDNGLCIPSEGGDTAPLRPWQIKNPGECTSAGYEWCETGYCTDRLREGSNCPTDYCVDAAPASGVGCGVGLCGNGEDVCE